MSSILDFFDDYSTESVTFYQPTISKNSAGQPIAGTDTTLQTGVEVHFWIDTSAETNVNDKFVDNIVGSVLVRVSDLTFVPTTKMIFKLDSKTYYIEGVDNIGNEDDFYEIMWRQNLGVDS
jgi:hypothetical protein